MVLPSFFEISFGFWSTKKLIRLGLHVSPRTLCFDTPTSIWVWQNWEKQSEPKFPKDKKAKMIDLLLRRGILALYGCLKKRSLGVFLWLVMIDWGFYFLHIQKTFFVCSYVIKLNSCVERESKAHSKRPQKIFVRSPK